ncbi:uncharacterized protein [Malus domestica]|uniref:uncharacterized protein n=1 Tax=Malus domestica TaxID=3750 RepID=UPI003976FB99
MTLSNFENLKMLESETFSIFYEKVEMLTNEALGLGKPIEETTIVQKILRCLPKRFQVENATIQEFQDLNEIKLEKLVGKLITYEMDLNMDESDSKKRKEVALHGVQNCEAVGDSDESSYDEEKVVAFVAQIEEVSLSDDDSVLNVKEEMTYNELCIKYETLFDETCFTKVKKIELAKKVTELQKENKSFRLVRIELDKKIGYLEAHVEELNEKAHNCNDKVEDKDVISILEAQANNVMYHEADKKQLLELNEANDKVICLTIGAEKFDKLLSFGKLHGEKSGIGFVKSGSNSIPTKIIVRESRLDQVDRLVIEVNRIAQLVHSSSSRNINQSSNWVQNDSNRCLVVLNAISVTKPNVWYLDNGCSCHMIGDNDAFSSLTPFIGGGVVFGGGDKSQITGKCDVKIPGLLKLKNVSYVDRLKSNLIIISQLCDDMAEGKFLS